MLGEGAGGGELSAKGSKIYKHIIIFINVMCLEYCTFFRSFDRDRSQEIFILMSLIIAEETKDQRAPRRRLLTWARIPRESLLTQDYKDIWGRRSSCPETAGLWKIWQIFSARLLVFLVSRAQTIWNTKTPKLTRGSGHCWVSPSQRHISSCLHQLCLLDLRSQEQPQIPPCFLVAQEANATLGVRFLARTEGFRTLVQVCELNSSHCLTSPFQN